MGLDRLTDTVVAVVGQPERLGNVVELSDGPYGTPARCASQAARSGTIVGNVSSKIVVAWTKIHTRSDCGAARSVSRPCGSRLDGGAGQTLGCPSVCVETYNQAYRFGGTMGGARPIVRVDTTGYSTGVLDGRDDGLATLERHLHPETLGEPLHDRVHKRGPPSGTWSQLVVFLIYRHRERVGICRGWGRLTAHVLVTPGDSGTSAETLEAYGVSSANRRRGGAAPGIQQLGRS